MSKDTHNGASRHPSNQQTNQWLTSMEDTADHDDMLDVTPTTNTSVRQIHTGPYRSGLSATTSLKDSCDMGHKALRMRADTWSVSTSKYGR